MNKDNIIGLNTDKTTNLSMVCKEGTFTIAYDCHAKGVFGLGERYCSVNHLGKTLINRVEQKFCEQGERTYFPLPFYHASDGHGVFVDTANEVVFRFTEGNFQIELPEDAKADIYFYYGSPKEILHQFIKQTGETVIPPIWSFGVWASANRWNSQKAVEEQMALIKEHKYPVSVLVLEAWSDEATFYLWNGADCPITESDVAMDPKQVTYQEPWPDPQKMIEQLHEQNIKCILWQIPALKKMEEGRDHKQNKLDRSYANEHQLVAMHEDGTPYQIPEEWFIGSFLPDFANPKTREWWFQKRQYLLDMGVDGFKTDGGEFVYNDNICFQNGKKGREIKNPYPVQYEKAYADFIGKDRVLFSRAGYLGSQTTPIHWAGDQLSTFDEFKAVLRAGISLSLSGVPFWSFDIGGFAGPLPSAELYLRATACAAFVPAMQWHSEPAGGQFEERLKGTGGTNDRSPWNMALVEQNRDILDKATFFANLHMNFLPYLYSEAVKCSIAGEPLMKHLFLEYPEDEQVLREEDTYMIGDLLVAPVTSEGKEERTVYLPEGEWFDFWNGQSYKGQNTIQVNAPLSRIPLFLREGGAVILNVGKDDQLGSTLDNQVHSYQNLLMLTAGEAKTYDFRDHLQHSYELGDGRPDAEKLTIKVMTLGSYYGRKD